MGRIRRPQKTKREIKEGVAVLKAYLMEGEEAEDIMEAEDWNEQDFNFFAAKLLEWETVAIKNRSIEEVYVDYTMNQSRLIKELKKVADRFGKSNQYNALVGAIKAQSDIYDKIIAKGQEFGLIYKAPKGVQFVGTMAVADMSASEVRTMMERELAELAAIENSEFGDTISVTDDGLTVVKGGSVGEADVIDIAEAPSVRKQLPVPKRKTRKTKGKKKLKK